MLWLLWSTPLFQATLPSSSGIEARYRLDIGFLTAPLQMDPLQIYLPTTLVSKTQNSNGR